MKLSPLYFLLLFAFIGCSKAPQDYHSAPANQPLVDTTKAAPTITDVENPTIVSMDGLHKPAIDIIKDPLLGSNGEGSAIADAKAKANSQQPIVYATGAGGINFKTTLDEAEQLLSKPRSGPDSQGTAYYEGEGLVVQWRTDEPRIPNFILILSDYQGSMKMPGTLASVGTNHDFAAVEKYEKNENGAKQLARDYYRSITGKTDSKDCIADQTCQVTWGTKESKNFFFEIPGRLLWSISKDRFVLYQMLLLKQIDQGILGNDIDILSGRVLIPQEKEITFGDAFKNIEERLKVDTYTSVGTDTYGREYDGVYLGYQRTDFNRTATTPLPTDKLKLIQVWNNYRNNLTLDGTPIVVREGADTVDILTAAEAQVQAPADGVREIPFVVNLALKRANVKAFGEKLTKFLETQLRQKYPSSMITSRFSGGHQVIDIKSYSGYAVAFDTVKNEGIYLSFGVGEEQGNLENFVMMKLGGDFNSFDPKIMSSMTTPIEKEAGLATFASLSGFKIGDEIAVKDWDLGRGEATAVYAGGSAPIETRVSYSDISIMFVAFNTEKDEPQDEAFIGVGSMGITLGLTLTDEAVPPLAPQRTYKVVSITSSLNTTEVRGLCGKNFVPRFGMSDVEFLALLKAQPDCQTLVSYDTTGNGRVSFVYFPDDRIRLGFGDEELIQAAIYVPVNEVK